MDFRIRIIEGDFIGEGPWVEIPGTGKFNVHLWNGPWEFGFICQKERIGQFILDGIEKINEKIKSESR